MGLKNHAPVVIAAANIASDVVEEIAAGTAVANTILGTKVTKATADTINTAAVPLFTISGGRVLVTAIFGEVTTIIQAQATNSKLQFNPTTGTTTDLCANLDINADEVGTLYSISGNGSDVMRRVESGHIRNMTALIMSPGQIEQISVADSTGSIQWTLYYVPIDSGASVAAA